MVTANENGASPPLGGEGDFHNDYLNSIFSRFNLQDIRNYQVQ